MNHPSGMRDPGGAALGDPLALGPGSLGVAVGVIGPAQLVDDGGIDAQTALPAEHPAWRRDAVSVSARARAVLATLRAVTVRVVTFWDHAVRGVRLGSGRSVEVDPSGCYRVR